MKYNNCAANPLGEEKNVVFHTTKVDYARNYKGNVVFWA
jgi:hypothetical protein